LQSPAHKEFFFHQKVKFENILFENGHQDAEIKLVDFGMSRRISNDQGISYGKGGTPYVMSPEALQGYYSTKTDIWSVGVISFMLLFGK
jgi:calcium-dependent protein kinase